MYVYIPHMERSKNYFLGAKLLCLSVLKHLARSVLLGALVSLLLLRRGAIVAQRANKTETKQTLIYKNIKYKEYVVPTRSR